jgi:hypothetical protein
MAKEDGRGNNVLSGRGTIFFSKSLSKALLSSGRSPFSRTESFESSLLPSAPLDLIGYLSFPSFGTQTPSRSTRFHSLLNIYLHVILVLLNLIPKVSVHTFADDGAIFGRFMEYLQADSRCL